MAALGDIPRPVQRVLDLAEKRHHLGPRLYVKLRGREAHPVRIRHRLAGLDAEQNLVRAHVVVGQIMGVVRDDQRNAAVSADMRRMAGIAILS